MSDIISNGKVVGFSYTLKSSSGETLDRSEEPLLYIHGMNNIIPGLESALEGLAVGAQKNVKVEAAQAYGTYDDALVQTVSKDAFPPDANIEVGMSFESSEDEGMVFYVKDVTTDSVTMDGNHPLAGQDLHFDVKIDSIREATKDEISHGHVHGPGGHHH